jgi:hypothetical protein
MPEPAKFGPGVERQAAVRIHERKRGEPVTRPLKVYTLDSTTSRIEGGIATADVPYEPLQPGPEGLLFYVDPRDGATLNSAVDLDDPRILIRGGLDPSPSNHQFHQQMVYAVCSKVYAQFQRALGRLVAWGFDREGGDPARAGKLRLRPHAAQYAANAAYEKETGELCFGYYRAPETGIGRNAPNAFVFTCLSHDIIAHELTHALLDGLRSHFTVPTSRDVMGFHEGFADLVAVFQHFTYPKALEEQIRRFSGAIDQSEMLAGIAENFGLTTGGSGPLRSAIGKGTVRYKPEMEAHEMGSVLLTAVFRALLTVFKRRTEPYIRLAYTPPSGYLAAELISYLASTASELAGRLLEMCIRAIDYCPPVDMHLGEFLRAVITASRELVPEDAVGYREALIDSFAAHGVYPPGVGQLAEDSLVWRPPARYIEPIEPLHFANLRFAGDPSLPASPAELRRQAGALWDFVTRRENCEEFGLAEYGASDAEPPTVQSIRTARRVGPNGEVLFDLVAEITQRRMARDPETGAAAKFVGGSTVILGPTGEVRFIISKNIGNDERLSRQLAFQRESGYWGLTGGQYRMRGYAHQLAHHATSEPRP